MIKLVHLYPDAMDLYGDTGNVLTLVRRCEWRGIAVEIVPVTLEHGAVPDDADLLIMGGGQDTAQALVAADLATHAERIRSLVAEGAAALAVCGGFQLFGTSYETAAGERLPGIGVFDAHTVAAAERLIGNAVVETIEHGPDTIAVPPGVELVGFENHAGRTHLGRSAMPLGRVLSGAGNAGDGVHEGAVVRNAVGTYLHGPLLPRNPRLADGLILAALRHRYGVVESLAPLDDDAELCAHGAALSRGRTGEATARQRLAR